MSIRSLVEWFKSWDFMAILYGLIPPLIGVVLLWWAGAFRLLKRKYRHRLAVKRYRSTLAEECGLLTVVGRRKGFRLQEVYVPLDIAPSDLMSLPTGGSPDAIRTASAHVLVGGPGAGKSTTVKRMLLDHLQNRRALPMFLRLRDYVGFEGIEQCITHMFQTAGFADPLEITRNLLHSSHAFCVLDGLDEVRPQLREAVISDVNAFYHKYFLNANRLVVTCRKEAYRRIPLDIPVIAEVRPLTDEQIRRFASKWPLGFPPPKTPDTFWRDLTGTPRILELARSPLLLVGGLMQYTESNAGVPEERFEYLGRVARWLTVEWATAQGHPPDKYRQVYDRILAKLAFHLHMEQRSDLERSEAERLFRDWLPTFGRSDVAPAEVIEAIATRTGILVTDDKNFLVFAQFGLQEYFASLEVATQVAPEKLTTLTPKEWWREVILLAIAQQREPTPILLRLFEEVPLMAASAVAECPTPSTEIQNRAVNACLAGIASGDKEAGSAAALLLRKVQGEVETHMCSLLEQHLNEGGSTASVVGIALATAGTDSATNILAKHPEVWDQCLKEAGYLSASFENLLVDWIEKGTDSQSARASELIASRLSSDRLLQLLRLLPSLDPVRAERLATLIIDHSGPVFEARPPYLVEVPLPAAARCASLIKDRQQFLSNRVDRAMTRLRAEQSALAHAPGFYYVDRPSEPGLVGTCLYMEDRSGNRLSEQAMYRDLLYTVLWVDRQRQFFLWTLSAALVPAVLMRYPASVVWPLVCVGAATILCTVRLLNVPWTDRWIGGSSRATSFTSLCIVAAGTAGGCLVGARAHSWLSDLLILSAAGLITIASLSLGVGWYFRGIHDYELEELKKLLPRPLMRRFSLVYPVVFLICLVCLGIIGSIGFQETVQIQYLIVALALVFFSWIITSAMCLVRSFRCVSRAAKTCMNLTAKLVEGKR